MATFIGNWRVTELSADNKPSDKKLLIIGLDGLDIDVVRKFGRRHMPFLFSLFHNSNWIVKAIKVSTVAHTAPSWITMMTGTLPEQHGVWHFYKTSDSTTTYTRDDIPVPFVWEILTASGIDACVFDMGAILPPLNYRCQFPFDIKHDISITYGEIKQSIDIDFGFAEKLCEQNREFIFFIATAIDKINHKCLVEDGMEIYHLVDNRVRKLVQLFPDYSVLIVSDHGLPILDHGFRHDGINIPIHTPIAYLAAKNFPEVTAVRGTIDIFQAILRFFDIEDLTSINLPTSLPTDNYTARSLSAAESKEIERRLRDLGYIE